MAVSISCQCCNAKVLGSGNTNTPRISSPAKVESAAPRFASTAAARETTSTTSTPSIATQRKESSTDDTIPSGYTRWATLAAAAAASISVLSAAPAVWAGEREVYNSMLTHSSPGDLSLSIAIPIPDPDTWTYSQYGFLAPPPRGGGEVAVVSNYQGGCPAWQPSQFEMIVPDGVHPKHNPRHGSQWPALYMLEEATIQHNAIHSNDSSVKYASLIDALLRMSDVGLTCFSL